MTSSERAWAEWLAHLLFVLLPRTGEAAQAIEGARAALDDIATTDPKRSVFRIPRLELAQLSLWPGRVPLKIAGHATTLAVVIAVALSARDPERLLQRPAGASALPVAQIDPSAADILIQRSVAVQPAEAGVDTPAARLLDVQALPAFTESHTLAEGETLGQVAGLYHVSVASLFWSNNLGSGTVFAAGQELRIPRLAGIPHIIQDGETLDSIAAQFNVRPQAIELFKPNNVQAARPLPVGREIFIPGATLPYPEEILAKYGGEQGLANLVAAAGGLVQESETNIRTGPGRDYPTLGTLDAGRRLKLLARHDTWVKVEHGADQIGWVRADLLGLSQDQIAGLAETSDFPPPPVRWVWPTHGEITSPFGWRSAPFRSFHDGLDIANAAWTKIYAARRGRVFEAGWCSGFGYCVKIDHGDGVTTIYGHLIKKPPVRVGDTVDAGDIIGYMGSTFDRSGGGYSTGVHLHFTLKVNGKAVNPLKFLP